MVLAISKLCAAYQILAQFYLGNRPSLQIFSVQSASRNGLILAQILAHGRNGLRVRMSSGSEPSRLRDFRYLWYGEPKRNQQRS